MSTFVRRISLCFAAGCFGALVNALLVWYLGDLGLPRKFGVAIAPNLTPQFLYAKLVWGGLWGMLFMAPFWRRGFGVGVVGRGILFSLAPTLFQLFFVFPVLQHKGMMGLALGRLTPVFVCFYNAAWGLCTGLWLYVARAES